MKDAMLFRNSLVPYLYTAAFNYFQSGIAPVHPVYYHWPSDPMAYSFDSQYMFGQSVIASPISMAINGDPIYGSSTKSIYIPGGTWSNWNGTKVYTGPTTVADEIYGVQDIPLFAYCSAVLPLRDMNSVASTFADPVIWVSWGCADAGEGSLYEDDGESLEYLTPGASMATTAVASSVNTNAQQVSFKVGNTQGSFPGMPSSRSHSFQVRGWNVQFASPSMVMCGSVMVNEGNGVPGWYISATHSLSQPLGTLVVNCGPLSVEDSIAVVISY